MKFLIPVMRNTVFFLVIHQHVKDPRGTGGKPYMQWLQQLIEETEAYKI